MPVELQVEEAARRSLRLVQNKKIEFRHGREARRKQQIPDVLFAELPLVVSGEPAGEFEPERGL